MTAIRIENLSKTYPPSFPRLKKFFNLKIKPPVEALKNVSFEVGDGEIFGLIGKNGAGKTTLTKIIATLVQPTSGRVSVRGVDSVRDEVGVRGLIGLATAEERSFYWRLNCEQNLLFFARLYGMTDAAARRKIKRTFADLNLSDLAKRRFAELSTGNKQRLAIARALLPNPPVLLLDEPTRSLDPLAADHVRALVLSLKGVSVLLTSHNLVEVEALCNRVAVISNGEIRAVDTPENLRRAHRQTQTVKIFVGNSTESKLRHVAESLEYNFSIVDKTDFLLLQFDRDGDDDLLGKTVAALDADGARIIDVETEKATLLDVLERFEQTNDS